MSSPFSTFEEFSEAEGPIYTFANNPTMLTLLLLISLAITVYFFYASFNLKQETKPQNPGALAMVILAGAASLLGSLLSPQPAKQAEVARDRSEARSALKHVQPFTLLGLMGVGGAAKRRSPRRRAARRGSSRW